MPNTSATGGYLQQTTGPVVGVDFRRFVAAVLAGLSGLAANLVRPAWQPNPPPVPDADTDWMAFAQTATTADLDTYQAGNADGTSTAQTLHEEREYTLTFYGPGCMTIAAALRDAAKIGQNRGALFSAGVTIAEFGGITHAPELVNDRWYDRCDMAMTLRREIRRDYKILSLLSATGAIYANRATTTLERSWPDVDAIYANRAPTAITLDGVSVPADAETGAVVGAVVVSDPDYGDTHTVTLISQQVPGAFTLTAGSIRVADRELLGADGATHILTLRAVDAGGLSVVDAVTVTVTVGEGGGSGAPEMPLAGYVGGFDVGALAQADMTNIVSLPDVVRAASWSQGAVSRQPLLVHDAIGGRAIARFSVDDALTSDGFNAIRVSGGVVSCVLRTSNAGAGYRVLLARSGGPSTYAGATGANNQPSVFTSVGFSCGQSVADGVPHIVQFVFRLDGTSHIRIDGAQVGGNFAFAGSASETGLWQAGGNAASNSQFFSGDIGQIAIHDGSADIDGIYHHLAHVWGLA